MLTFQMAFLKVCVIFLATSGDKLGTLACNKLLFKLLSCQIDATSLKFQNINVIVEQTIICLQQGATDSWSQERDPFCNLFAIPLQIHLFSPFYCSLLLMFRHCQETLNISLPLSNRNNSSYFIPMNMSSFRSAEEFSSSFVGVGGGWRRAIGEKGVIPHLVLFSCLSLSHQNL